MEEDAAIFTNYLAEKYQAKVIHCSSETRGCIAQNILKPNDKVRSYSAHLAYSTWYSTVLRAGS